MKSPNDNLENLFREALQNKEMPYDPQAWDTMNKKIVQNGLRKPAYSTGLVAAATVTIALVVAASIYVAIPKNKIFDSLAINTPTKTNNVIPNENKNIKPTEQNNNQNNDLVVVDDKERIESSSNDKKNLSPITANNNNNNLSYINNENSEENVELENEIINDNNEDYISSNESSKSDNNFGIPKDVELLVSKNEACAEEKITFSAINTDNCSVIWEYNGQEFEGESVTLSFKNSGTQTIACVLLRDNKVVQVKNTSVTILSAPKNEIVVIPPSNKAVPTYKFELENENIKNVIWKADNYTSQNKKGEMLFRKKGEHKIIATYEGFNGCSNQIQTSVYINNNYNLLAPNALEPNHTNYDRKTFIPQALKVLDVPFEMVIYDRNNKMVYKTTRVDEPWTGVDMNTNQIPRGSSAYVWVVKLKNKEGKEEIYYGSVTLIN